MTAPLSSGVKRLGEVCCRGFTKSACVGPAGAPIFPCCTYNTRGLEKSGSHSSKGKG